MSDTRTPPPSVGFNHNVSYQARVFHVQTEDSGLPHAHVITHLFLGGNVVATRKSTYTHLVGQTAELGAAVRKLMEEQHKAMMRGLLRGEHDAAILQQVGATAYDPGVLAGGLRAPEPLVGGSTPRPKTLTPTPLAAPRAMGPTGRSLFDSDLDDPPLHELVLRFLASHKADG